MKRIGVIESSEKNLVEFITEERLRRGSFVFYRDQEFKKPILCRVKGSSTLERIPTEFLDPGLEPMDAAKKAGFDLEDIGKFLVNAKIIGYYDDDLGEFVNPKISPISGTPVFLAKEEVLNQVNKRKDDEANSATIGSVIDSDTKVVLDVADIVSTHLSIIASTGSGKSYTVGVLLEELLKTKNGASCVVFDPHGEYRELCDLLDRELLEKKELIDEYKYSDGNFPEVEVFDDEDIKVKVSDLTFNELVSIIDDGNFSEKMRHYFRQAYREVSNKEFTKRELFEEITNLTDDEGNKLINSSQHSSSIEALQWRYRQNILNKKFFQNYSKLNLNQVFSPRKISILDLSAINERDQQLVASILLRKTFAARKGTERGDYTEGEFYLPFPVFSVIEESHRFCPSSTKSKSKNILKKVLSEGRKFGVGVCLISQRPSKLDSDSLSQCMTQITMRLINPHDQRHIEESLESMNKELVNMLPSLSTGEAIISGEAINTSINAKIREKITRHGGSGINDPSLLWKAGLSDEEPDRANTEIEEDEDFDLFSN